MKPKYICKLNIPPYIYNVYIFMRINVGFYSRSDPRDIVAGTWVIHHQ